jgi:hypothetical protein
VTDNRDIIAAIANYVASVMGQSLSSATETNPDGSFTAAPYAIVHDGPETYRYQSNDPETGCYTMAIADGIAMVQFIGRSKAEARALGRDAVKKISRNVVELLTSDGTVIHLSPQRGESPPVPKVGIEGQYPFSRVINVRYEEQFPL